MKPTTQSFKKSRVIDYIKGSFVAIMMATIAIATLNLTKIVDWMLILFKGGN